MLKPAGQAISRIERAIERERNFMKLLDEALQGSDMVMHDLKWSGSEKKVARRAYEAALERVLAEVMHEFKEMAAEASTPSDMWDVEAYLREKRHELSEIFDYRYSRLLFAFAWLIREGYLKESDLRGLSDDKLETLQRMLSPLPNQ